MEPTNKINDCGEIPREEKNNQKHITWKVLGIFAVVVALVCGVVFLYNYGIAYDDNMEGWIPPSFAVVYYYFCVAVVAIIVSVFLKSIWKNRVRFWLLFLASVLIPIICYQFNYHTLKKDGILYPLVDEGGIFHFMAIGDYDFDGMNDEQHHRLYEEREYSSRYGGHFDDTIIDYIDTTAVGTGPSLSGTFCFYDWEERTIDLHLDKTGVDINRSRLRLLFKMKQWRRAQPSIWRALKKP